MEPIIIPLRPVLLFVVVLARVGGLVTFAPFWGHQAVNARMRATLALALALVLTPALSARLAAPPTDLIGLAVVIVTELAVGCLIGFIGRMIFSALEVAAQVTGFQMGLSLAATIDPATRAQTAALGTIAQMFGLMVLLAADGHHWLLAATVRSYHFIGEGSFVLTPHLAEVVLRLSADMLTAGVALAAPAIIVLVSVEFILAIAGRAAPQLQVMVLGFPIKIAVGLWLLGASLFFLPGAVRTIFSTLNTAIKQVFSG
ncbi:MAG TPA: flagellar biosynthetic protein FliR [Blastocatellia bacterium]|nr:flagellar biosynthetic protein FliR [Blastocatellia bacterium]